MRKIFAEKNEKLGKIVENAQCDKRTYGIIRRQASGILEHLGIRHENAIQWLDSEIWNFRVSEKGLLSYEADLHASLQNFGIYSKLNEKMSERASMWFEKIAPYLLQKPTLDFGGGSGEVAMLMQKHGCRATIADAINWNKTQLPFMQIKDNVVSAKNNSFDQVVVLTVFHHSDDVSKTVSESFRVAKKRLVFIESVTENQLGYSYGAWIDWFYNRVIHFSDDPAKKINVPCNFLPSDGWENLVWKLTGLKAKISESLGIFQWLNPENHHLFAYEKE